MIHAALFLVAICVLCYCAVLLLIGVAWALLLAVGAIEELVVWPALVVRAFVRNLRGRL